MGRYGGVNADEFIQGLRERRNSDVATRYPGWGSCGRDKEIGYTMEEKTATFIDNVNALGGEATYEPTERDAFQHLTDLLVQANVNEVLVGSECDELIPFLRAEGIVPHRRVDVDLSAESSMRDRTRIDKWNAGVQWAQFGAADCGAVALQTPASSGRLISLLPPFFIALLSIRDLRYYRRTVFREVVKKRMNGNPLGLTFIAGPSRSADIEMDLSIGVHGPGRVSVIVVGDRG